MASLIDIWGSFWQILESSIDLASFISLLWTWSPELHICNLGGGPLAWSAGYPRGAEASKPCWNFSREELPLGETLCLKQRTPDAPCWASPPTDFEKYVSSMETYIPLGKKAQIQHILSLAFWTSPASPRIPGHSSPASQIQETQGAMLYLSDRVIVSTVLLHN